MDDLDFLESKPLVGFQMDGSHLHNVLQNLIQHQQNQAQLVQKLAQRVADVEDGIADVDKRQEQMERAMENPDAIRQMRADIEDLGNGMSQISREVPELRRGIDDARRGAQQAERAAQQAAQAIPALEDQVEQLGKDVDDLGRALRDQEKGVGQQLKDLEREADRQAKQADDLMRDIQQRAERMERDNGIQKLRAMIEDLSDRTDENFRSVEESAKAVDAELARHRGEIGNVRADLDALDDKTRARIATMAEDVDEKHQMILDMFRNFEKSSTELEEHLAAAGQALARRQASRQQERERSGARAIGNGNTSNYDASGSRRGNRCGYAFPSFGRMYVGPWQEFQLMRAVHAIRSKQQGSVGTDVSQERERRLDTENSSSFPAAQTSKPRTSISLRETSHKPSLPQRPSLQASDSRLRAHRTSSINTPTPPRQPNRGTRKTRNPRVGTGSRACSIRSSNGSEVSEGVSNVASSGVSAGRRRGQWRCLPDGTASVTDLGSHSETASLEGLFATGTGLDTALMEGGRSNTIEIIESAGYVKPRTVPVLHTLNTPTRVQSEPSDSQGRRRQGDVFGGNVGPFSSSADAKIRSDAIANRNRKQGTNWNIDLYGKAQGANYGYSHMLRDMQQDPMLVSNKYYPFSDSKQTSQGVASFSPIGAQGNYVDIAMRHLRPDQHVPGDYNASSSMGRVPYPPQEQRQPLFERSGAGTQRGSGSRQRSSTKSNYSATAGVGSSGNNNEPLSRTSFSDAQRLRREMLLQLYTSDGTQEEAKGGEVGLSGQEQQPLVATPTAIITTAGSRRLSAPLPWDALDSNGASNPASPPFPQTPFAPTKTMMPTTQQQQQQRPSIPQTAYYHQHLYDVGAPIDTSLVRGTVAPTATLPGSLPLPISASTNLLAVDTLTSPSQTGVPPPQSTNDSAEHLIQWAEHLNFDDLM